MSFAPGTKVSLIDDPSRTGETTGRTQQRGPFTYVEVRFGANDVKPVRSEFLQLAAEGPLSIEDRIQAGLWGKADDLRRVLTHEKLKGCLHNVLYSMDAAQIEFHEYQFKPVLKFINSPTERLLIADEVGLGKTIEAALIWLEMRARYDARRLLVVCPNMLAQKWRCELRDKFGVPAEIGTAEKLLDALGDLRRRPDTDGFAWICTYSGLRPFRRELSSAEEDDAKRSPRGKFFHECENWEGERPMFDLTIFDEAHYLRNPKSLTSKLGVVLCREEVSRAALLVSATPVNNSNTDLLTLLKMVNPDFFDNQKLFNHLLAENRAAVHAANHLGAYPPRLAEARLCLEKLGGSSFVGKSPLLVRARELLAAADPRDERTLLEALETIDQLNVLGAYVSRTRRVQVKERRPLRVPVIRPVTFDPVEMEFYQTVTMQVRQRVERAKKSFSAFHLTLPQQQMASCIPAVAAAMRARSFGSLDEDEADPFFDAPESEMHKPITAADRVASVGERLLAFDYEAVDSKYHELRQLLQGQFDGEKVIIFAYFRGTLSYLGRRLYADGFGCATIHGGIETELRLAEIDRFRDDPAVTVLLSSEVGSEGLDLQFCSVVINYDLPWNPMRVEQRIGRIDRVGQKAPRLRIVHFKVRGTVEERLYDRLHAKLSIFENSLGDLEAVLGEEMQELSLTLLGRNLTPAEADEQIDRTRMALENRLRLAQRLEEEGESLLAFSDLITDRVDQTRQLGRYVTAEEMRSYIFDFFARNYRGCVLDWDAPRPGCFRLELTFDAHDRLDGFIRQHRLPATGFHGRKLAATFDPENIGAADPERRGGRLVFINHLSPLVRWITEENRNAANAFHSVSALTLSYPELSDGDYVYWIERWSFAGLRTKDSLAYGLARIDGTLTLLNAEAEGHVGHVVRSGRTWAYPEVSTAEALASLQTLRTEVGQSSYTALEQFRAENDNLREIQATAIRNHCARRRHTDEQRLSTARARGRQVHFVRMLEGNLARTAEIEQERLHKLDRDARVTEDYPEVACGVVRIISP